MTTGIIRLDQFPKGGRIKSKGPSKRQMMNMQRQHEQAMKELDRQLPPASGEVKNFVFTR